MRANPTGYLHSIAEDCCKAHYQWDIATCRMNSLGEPLFYPLFDSEMGGCKNDGLEPFYIKRYEGYFFDTLEGCCETYFSFSLAECVNPSDVVPCYSFMEMYDVDYLERGYYPVFTDENNDIYCLNDGNAPAYMQTFPKAWKHDTLEQCCRTNFQFLFRECMGSLSDIALNPCIQETVDDHTFKWYVIYHQRGNPECVQDCHIGPDCNSWSNYHEELYVSYMECCDKHLWYIEDSRCPQQALVEPGFTDVFTDVDKVTQPEHTFDWYVVYHMQGDPECVQDCVPGPDCYGVATLHDELYKSFDECCDLHLWWVTDSPCPLV